MDVREKVESPLPRIQAAMFPPIAWEGRDFAYRIPSQTSPHRPLPWKTRSQCWNAKVFAAARGPASSDTEWQIVFTFAPESPSVKAVQEAFQDWQGTFLRGLHKWSAEGAVWAVHIYQGRQFSSPVTIRMEFAKVHRQGKELFLYALRLLSSKCQKEAQQLIKGKAPSTQQTEALVTPGGAEYDRLASKMDTWDKQGVVFCGQLASRQAGGSRARDAFQAWQREVVDTADLLIRILRNAAFEEISN